MVDTDPDVKPPKITINGLISLCEELEIDLENVRPSVGIRNITKEG
jgi:hypothetical protein